MVTIIARHRNYTFQYDNIRAHFARPTIDFLQPNDMDVMPWPALSPCLHLIEHPKYNKCFCDTFVNNTFQVLEGIGTEVNIVYFLLRRGLDA
jgi:hypothetical protein